MVPLFCTGSDHRLLRAKIRFSLKLEKISCHRRRRKDRHLYDGKLLNEILSMHDWLVKEDPNEDYELHVNGLKSCADLASIPEGRSSDRISITTKELLEKRRKLRLDPNATHLARVIINVNCRKSLKEDIDRYKQKKLLDAAKKD